MSSVPINQLPFPYQDFNSNHCHHKWVEAATLFDQESLPLLERERYLRYSQTPDYRARLYITAEKTNLFSSLLRFRQAHTIDSYPPNHPCHFDLYHPLPSTDELMEEFSNAEYKDDYTHCTPSASLTDIQLLTVTTSTGNKTKHFPVLAVYPGKETNINPLDLGHFFYNHTGYTTAITILKPNHPISQHKTQTPVADLMTSFQKPKIYVVHPYGTYLPGRYSAYSPMCSADGSSKETFHRVDHYTIYEQPIIESIMERQYHSRTW